MILLTMLKSSRAMKSEDDFINKVRREITMPGGDRTGPMGAGPMTGRGAGMCAGYDVPGYMNPSFGRGFGGGRGRGYGRGGGMGGGRGWRNQFYASGLPGWARGYDYPYPHPAGFPTGFSTAATPRATQAEELANLKEQAQYFKRALDDIEGHINELQQDAGNASEA